MLQSPERYGNNIIRLSNYMYLKSGYYKRLIDYFSNMGIINWTIDTEIKDFKFYSENSKTLQKNYIKFTAQCNKFKLNNIITDILKRIFLGDTCFGFITETDIDAPIFFLEPQYCEIKKLVNGNVYEYAINRSLLSTSYLDALPSQLQQLLNDSKDTSLNNMVLVPYDKSFCIKYNNDFTYSCPPFYGLIADILLIDDYKELAKAKTESDAYKLVYFKIPTGDDGQMTMGDDVVVPFVEMAKQIIPNTWGVVPSPMSLELIESKSTSSDDRNKVAEATESFYAEAGVSKSVISSASSGSELKLSMKVDSSDLYRIYRQLENWMSLQMKLRNFIYSHYDLVFTILNTTIFDTDDFIERQLKLAQASIPNKGVLAAANGINTAKLLGNSFMENTIFKDMFDGWTVLKTSYVQSGNSDAGSPSKDETELSSSGEQTRNGETNGNRIDMV